MANTKIPKTVPSRISFNQEIDETIAMSYTGVSVTIPANSAFALYVYAGYEAHKPSNTALSTSSTSLIDTYAVSNPGNSRYASFAGFTANTLTLYVWASFNAEGSHSKIYVNGWYQPI